MKETDKLFKINTLSILHSEACKQKERLEKERNVYLQQLGSDQQVKIDALNNVYDTGIQLIEEDIQKYIEQIESLYRDGNDTEPGINQELSHVNN